MDIINILTLIIGVMIITVIAKAILHFKITKIIGLIINSVLGYIVILLLNSTGLFSIPLNVLTTLIIGVFGIPGVILLILVDILGII